MGKDDLPEFCIFFKCQILNRYYNMSTCTSTYKANECILTVNMIKLLKHRHDAKQKPQSEMKQKRGAYASEFRQQMTLPLNLMLRMTAMRDTRHPAASSATRQHADYKAIFNQRGDAYHQAMDEFPEARNQEFLNIIKLADLKQSQTVCDVPSGGGYSQRYLPYEDYEIVALETSKAFYKYCKANGSGRAILTERQHRSAGCLGELRHQPGRTTSFARSPHLFPGNLLHIKKPEDPSAWLT